MSPKKKKPELENIPPAQDPYGEEAEGTDYPGTPDTAAPGTDSPAEAPEAPHGQEGADREAPNMLQALKDITSEEESDPESTTHISLSSILGGDILGGRWFRRNFFYILMVVAMIIVYVSNRYACQQEMITTKTLSDTLLDRRYKALTRSSQLKEKMRRSNIEENLADSTIQMSDTPSFNLKIDE